MPKTGPSKAAGKPRTGSKLVADSKLAPGIPKGAEVTLVAWDEDDAIVSVPQRMGVLKDGRITQEDMPVNYRVKASGLVKSEKKRGKDAD